MPRRTIHKTALALALVLAAASCRERQAPEEPPSATTGAATTGHDAGPDAAPASPPERPPPVRIVYPPAPGSFIQLVDELGNAVVNIRTTGKVTGGPASLYPNAGPDSSLGSGFIVDRQARYVLTNLHIVDKAKALQVVLRTGEERDAELIGRAPHLDIALLELAGGALPEDVPALAPGQPVRVGEWTVALGNPFGGEVTASAGIVSSLGTAASMYEPPQERYRSLIHTDASVHAGNSGGPLVNLAGEVVGVSTAMGRGSPLGFAVPMSQVERIFDSLVKGRVAETWLGIFVLPATEANTGACPVRGVAVTQVVPGSPAAKAGLRAGDVIVQFDGHDVDAPALAALARTTVPGQRIPVVLCRGGAELERELVAEEKPR